MIKIMKKIKCAVDGHNWKPLTDILQRIPEKYPQYTHYCTKCGDFKRSKN